MKYLNILFLLFLFACQTAHAQCTPEKDPQMKKYLDKVNAKENVQSCSECGMLALYLCSAQSTATAEDKVKVERMIKACVANIQIMGDPICCPELVSQARNPKWGARVGGVAGAGAGGSGSGGGGAAGGGQGGGPTKEELEREALIAKIEGTVKNIESSYYSIQDMYKARNELEQASKMDGNFTSVEQIEAEFQKKFNQISQGVTNAVAAENKALQETTNLYYSNMDATGQAVGQLGALLGGLLNEAEARQRQREYEEKLKKQKQEQLYKLNAMKSNQLFDLRKAFLNTYPDGGLPLVKDAIPQAQVFFFSYSVNSYGLDKKNLPIAVTNVFPLVKNPDGTWPFKDAMVKDLRNSYSNDQKPVLVGFFTSLSDAINVRNSFIAMARQSGLQIEDVVYTQTLLTKTTPPGQSKKQDDFWDK